MHCSSRLSRTREAGTGPGRAGAAATILFVVMTVAVFLPSTQAEAATIGPGPSPSPSPSPTPTPTPSPTPTPTVINSDLSAGSTVTNLGSNFLERLGSQASSGFGNALRSNPAGGGASEATDVPRFRAWGEAYGISSNAGAVGVFVGDHRQTWGGVAGLGAQVMPGVNVGFSVDQSRTAIDVPLALQTATLDLSQFGFNVSVDRGPWTWAAALVHGSGNINSSRNTGAGIATAGYGAEVNGALTELSYYWNLEQSRIVPKAAIEYVQANTGGFQEIGGLDPVMASGASEERARILLGAEIGHYWIFDRKVLDLSGYGKFVDNIVQNFNSSTVSLGAQSITVQGVGESRYGADAGASASLNLTSMVRVYANYDGKFRAALQSHQGTVGVEVRW
jgi:uncharacterized protein with beta-barrel porin domain